MLVDYQNLTEKANVWVYPSSRKFYPQEIDGLLKKIEQFAKYWKFDDENYKVSYQFLYRRFIIFVAEVKNLSITNNDINLQVQFILQLQKEYKINLLDRMNICFKQGEFIQYKELKEFKKLLKEKSISKKTIVFDNLVQTKNELENYWEIPITQSWYNRFL